MLLHRFRLALPLAALVLLVDCTTKELAVQSLAPEEVPHAIAGDVVRFTLAYNRGAAMSLPIGSQPRWPLVALGFGALAVIVRLVWLTPPDATSRRVALGLILGGALGNLVSRLSTARGVVDFIDIGLGSQRFYVFNVADVGITVGACLLAYSLWHGDAIARLQTLPSD
jgi:signal peptidase II